MTDYAPGATRRRGAVLEDAIFAATLDQLRTVGYSGLTMEGVAASAQTGKAALYRRWPSKEELIVDALHHALPPLDDVPDTGDVRKDVLALLRRVAAVVNSPGGCALQALMGEIQREPAFVEAVHARVIEPRKKMMLTVLRRGVERGQVRPEAVKRIVAEVGPALVVHQLLVRGAPVSDAVVRSIVDDVIMPILRPAR